MPAIETSADRREDESARELLEGGARMRMLVIVNPYASTVSDRLKSLVLYALRSRYDVEAVETEAQGHATSLCREAAAAGYDVVTAFGGDGTVNEAANGLLGTETPLTCLPGGSTNVFCRTLGIPGDVVDAAEHLLRMADRFSPRRVDLGRLRARPVDEGPALDRHFVFSSGIGLDASVVERVDRRPHLKARLGEWYFTYAALSSFCRRYLVRPPRARVHAGERAVPAVTVIVQNSDPFTYFGKRPIRIGAGAGLESRSLSASALRRARPLELVTLLPRILSGRARTVAGHREVESLGPVEELRVSALETDGVPLQVDGDYLGEFAEVTYRVAPAALSVVS